MSPHPQIVQILESLYNVPVEAVRVQEELQEDPAMVPPTPTGTPMGTNKTRIVLVALVVESPFSSTHSAVSITQRMSTISSHHSCEKSIPSPSSTEHPCTTPELGTSWIGSGQSQNVVAAIKMTMTIPIPIPISPPPASTVTLTVTVGGNAQKSLLFQREMSCCPSSHCTNIASNINETESSTCTVRGRIRYRTTCSQLLTSAQALSFGYY